nr:MAG TPA: hypothetical protein [Caudoviricetes sp.]
MNPLFNQRKPMAGQQNNTAQLLDFIKSTNPQQAKMEVERLIKERGISATESEEYKQKAQQIAKSMGLM